MAREEARVIFEVAVVGGRGHECCPCLPVVERGERVREGVPGGDAVSEAGCLRGAGVRSCSECRLCSLCRKDGGVGCGYAAAAVSGAGGAGGGSLVEEVDVV